MGKRLNELKKADFTKVYDTHHYNYKNMEVVIRRDFLNGRWVYWSLTTHAVSGSLYGSVDNLKRQIRQEYNGLKK